MIIMHAGGDSQLFQIPAPIRKLPWRLFIDTAAPTPSDLFENLDGPGIPLSGRFSLVHHSMRCYVA